MHLLTIIHFNIGLDDDDDVDGDYGKDYDEEVDDGRGEGMKMPMEICHPGSKLTVLRNQMSWCSTCRPDDKNNDDTIITITITNDSSSA